MKPAPVDILCAVSRHTGLHPSLIRDARSFAGYPARMVYAALLRNLLGMQYAEIAREAGWASHVSALESCMTFQQSMSEMHDSEMPGLYMRVMNDLDMDKRPMKPGSAKLMSRGRVVAEMSSRLDGSVLVTFPGYPNERLIVDDWMKAGEMAKAWLAERGQEKEAA